MVYTFLRKVTSNCSQVLIFGVLKRFGMLYNLAETDFRFWFLFLRTGSRKFEKFRENPNMGSGPAPEGQIFNFHWIYQKNRNFRYTLFLGK